MRKRYLMSAIARNLGVVIRSLFGLGTARNLQAEGDLADDSYFVWSNLPGELKRLTATINHVRQKPTGEPTASLAFVLAA